MTCYYGSVITAAARPMKYVESDITLVISHKYLYKIMPERVVCVNIKPRLHSKYGITS